MSSAAGAGGGSSVGIPREVATHSMMRRSSVASTLTVQRASLPKPRPRAAPPPPTTASSACGICSTSASTSAGERKLSLTTTMGADASNHHGGGSSRRTAPGRTAFSRTRGSLPMRVAASSSSLRHSSFVVCHRSLTPVPTLSSWSRGRPPHNRAVSLAYASTPAPRSMCVCHTRSTSTGGASGPRRLALLLATTCKNLPYLEIAPARKAGSLYASPETCHKNLAWRVDRRTRSSINA
mmetsp:Transcript_35187/g.92077  ORF Transcript_35187/g.92077 Transcript_35187/m.92077 type:complete len:238 (+) Transcript_35187:1463-2176(+)